MSDLVKLLRKVDEEAMYAAPFTTKTLIDAAANRIEELEKKVAELEARPQQTYPLGGAGNHWPFAPDPEQPRWVEQNGKLRFVSPDNVSRETSGDPNEVR